MSSQDEASSVVSSSHDRSDDDWDGSDADAGAAKKKKKVVVAATSGRRQLARRPVKPRTTNTFGNYSSSDSSSSDSDDDVKNNNTDAQSNGKEEDNDDDSSAASSDSPPQKRQQPKKKIQRKNTTQPPKQKASAIAKESNNKSKSSVAKKSKKKVESESEEEEEWNDDEDQQLSESSESQSDSDSDFGAPSSSSNKRRGGNKTKKSPASTRKKSSTSTRTPRSKRTTRQSYDDESEQSSDNEEIQYHTTPTGTRRPSRSCSQRTNKRMSQVVKQDMKSERDALGEVLEDDDKELLENSSSERSDNDNDDDDKGSADDKRLQKRLRQNRVSNVRAKVVKRTNKYDDDDDYDENANSSNDDDDSDDNDDDDDDDFEIDSDDMAISKRRSNRTQQNRGSGGKKKPNYTEVDSDIGTADENTTDEETGPSLLTSPVNAKKKSSGSYGSPAVRKRARAGRGGRTPLDMREDDGSSSSNEEEDDEQQPSSKKRKQQTPASTRKRRPYMDSSDSDSDDQDATPHTGLRTTHNYCPSLIDDITMMNLPKNKPHVCYIAPDGKSRHCFTLDTLYRIAISAKGDRESTTSNEKLTFLQPPHFRSPMEDDLIDQIASRFGRSALEIENSAVYKKIKGGRLGSSSIDLDELDEFDEDGNFVGDGEGDGVNFQDRFQRFIATLMGSSDVYCCPLCYIEADRRLGNQDDDERVEDDESGDENEKGNESHVDRFSFLDDPLTILGNLDNEAFEVAATFCFRLLSGLKKHLKVVHGVNLSDIAGNDLFKRFQIRAGDGLLQRWLQKNLRRNTVQGDMMRYWNSGENQSFLLLLSQIDRCDQDYSADFSLSFPNRARKVWNQVSAPYLKQSEDLNDFIADDDEEIEEGDDGGVPINPHFTPPSINLKDPSDFKSPEEEMIANLQKKNRRYKSTYDDSDDASGSGGGKSSSSDEDELEILDPKPTTEESEDDEWTKSKSYSSKVKQKSAKAVGAKNNDSEDDVFDDDVEIIEEKPSASKTPTSARKRIMESSSDEESY